MCCREGKSSVEAARSSAVVFEVDNSNVQGAAATCPCCLFGVMQLRVVHDLVALPNTGNTLPQHLSMTGRGGGGHGCEEVLSSVDIFVLFFWDVWTAAVKPLLRV